MRRDTGSANALAADTSEAGGAAACPREYADAAPRVDGPHRRRPLVGRGVDADGVRAVRRDTGSANALAADTSEAGGAAACPREYADAAPRVDGPHRRRPLVGRGVDADGVRAVRRDTGSANALAADTSEAGGAAACPREYADAAPRVNGPQRRRPTLALGIDTH